MDQLAPAPRPANVGTMASITAEVASRHGYTPKQLRAAKSRWNALGRARQEAMALCWAAGKSNRQVANYFGCKDHTCTINARRAYAARAEVLVA